MKNDNEVLFSCRRKKVRDIEKCLENSCENTLTIDANDLFIRK